MQGNELFEYAVIRWVPRVEREEFLNVGIVLYCRGQRYLDMRYLLVPDRLRSFCPLVDVEELDACLKAFGSICRGGQEGGAIARLEPAERFRWLTAKRSTIIQVSAVHPGLCTDAQVTLDRLFGELVGP